jgi:hypothetical protein
MFRGLSSALSKTIRTDVFVQVLDHMRDCFRDMGSLMGDEITWPGKDSSTSSQHTG